MKKVPFPQANNMELMFNILKDIGDDGLSKSDIAKKYSIDERQGSYYLDALLYLDFVQKINSKYFLSTKGVKVRLSGQDEMINVFIDLILGHKYIGKLYSECKSLQSYQQQQYISSFIFNEIGLGYSTANRRANSIKSWFEWIDNHIRS